MWGLKSWVGQFFPAGTKQKDFLATYSHRFNTVEGNTTFYALPSVENVERWRDQTPPGFRFCFKVPQTITHQKRLVNAEPETEALVDRLRRLQDRCGATLLQLPPTFNARSLPVLAAYLERWPRDLALAVEPRHIDFFRGEGEQALADLLHRLNMAKCEFDTRGLRSASGSEFESAESKEAQLRKPNFPPKFARTASFAFVRFCGHPQLERNTPWLAEWAGHVAEWLGAGDDVYFFTHHTDDTYAPNAGHMFHELLSERVSLPPLPKWDATETNPDSALPTQPGLF